MVDLALDGSIGEHAGGLLEGGGGQEGVGGQGRLSNTHQDRDISGVLQSGLTQSDPLVNGLIGLVYLGHIHHGAGHQIGITGIVHGALLKHLTNDNLNVLVVNINTLGTVSEMYFLN